MVCDCQQCKSIYAGVDVGLIFVCKGCGSQVVMDEQGGSRAGDQVFALRQVVQKTIEKPRVTCNHFSKKPTVRVVTLLKSYILFLFARVFTHVHQWITQYPHPTRKPRFIIM